MRHALMQQGTLDVRFPPACGRYRQTRCEGMSYQPRMSFPQESRPRMSGEPTSSARRITSTGICCFPARKDTWRASSSIRASLERNICPSRAISSVETASVFRLWAEVKSSLLSTLRASTSPAVERYSCILLLKLPMSFTRSNIVSYPYLPATASRLELLSLNIVPP